MSPNPELDRLITQAENNRLSAYQVKQLLTWAKDEDEATKKRVNAALLKGGYTNSQVKAVGTAIAFDELAKVLKSLDEIKAKANELTKLFAKGSSVAQQMYKLGVKHGDQDGFGSDKARENIASLLGSNPKDQRIYAFLRFCLDEAKARNADELE